MLRVRIFAMCIFCLFVCLFVCQQIVQFKNLKQIVQDLPLKYISFNVLIFGELWKIPCNKRKAEWNDNINDDQLGNFIHVKDGILPTFEKCLLPNGEPQTTIVFGKDVICKLYPSPNCKHLNEQQYKNFYCKTSKTIPASRIYYYAFNNVDDWQETGGCVIVPQCTNTDCKKFACAEHMDLATKPKEFQLIHFCGFDYENRVCLLSHRQMIVNSFLKTGSTKAVHSPSEYVDDEDDEEEEDIDDDMHSKLYLKCKL